MIAGWVESPTILAQKKGFWNIDVVDLTEEVVGPRSVFTAGKSAVTIGVGARGLLPSKPR